MEDREISNIYAIPANYTDSGKLFGGLLEARNAVEAGLLMLVLGYPELALFAMPLRIRIVVMTLTLLPVAVLAMMGIDGDSLFQYISHMVKYMVHRRKLHFRRVGYRYGQADGGRTKKGRQPKAGSSGTKKSAGGRGQISAKRKNRDGADTQRKNRDGADAQRNRYGTAQGNRAWNTGRQAPSGRKKDAGRYAWEGK